MSLPDYPEYDEVLKALFDGLAPVVTFIDDDLPAEYIYVQRVGGREDGVFDNPVVDVEYVGPTRAASKALKKAGQERVRHCGNTAPGGFLIDVAEEVTGAMPMSPQQRDMREFIATNRFSYRRPRA
ncbi:hypothetical protein [Nocardia flavorosea]|uniref:Uncharacterized protein n=1 Tax=Nocardia flavorosea TaxID=53429 RepID=A0A846YL41_9NOCA|nr:hypothetical protein [Nocardia flavorosea]NKY60356.1 hypothetical protein [Nocardia flavorosea]